MTRMGNGANLRRRGTFPAPLNRYQPYLPTPRQIELTARELHGAEILSYGGRGEAREYTYNSTGACSPRVSVWLVMTF